MSVDFEEPSGEPCGLFFVAEAPGADEVREGRPLVGPSGRLFDQLLGVAGIAREECWIANVFDFKIPRNEFKALTWSATEEKRHAKAHPDEGALPPCIVSGKAKRYLVPEHRGAIERLAARLEAVKPIVVVPLGGTALWAITGATGIDNWRGTVTRQGGRVVVPTLHPARVLRQYKLFATVAGDLAKARGELALRGLGTQEPRPMWPVDLAAIEGWRMAAADMLGSGGAIAVDIETAAGQITHVGFGGRGLAQLVVPFVDEEKPGMSYWADEKLELEAWLGVERICMMPNPKVMQNGLYDMFWLERFAGVRVVNYCEDTRLLHHALWPELPKALGYMGQSHLRVGPWKGQRPKAEETKRDA